MQTLRKSWWALAAAGLLMLVLLNRLSAPTLGGDTGTPSLKMNLEPSTSPPDPGPELILGAEQGKGKGTNFPWVDVTPEGACQDYRIYFDRQDNENFHFLDRKGKDLILGLCEGGVEQVFARAAMQGSEQPRVARHGAQIGVFEGGRLALSAFDDRRMGGTVGMRRIGTDAALTLKAERREDVHFADDFMREEKDKSPWRKINCSEERGDFMIKNLRHPLLSANAFNYMGTGDGVLSVIGEKWWDNYRFESSLRGPEKGQIGLVFALQDEKNYGLFRWTARPVNADGSTTGPGKKELVLVRDGKEQVLASGEGGYLPDQWYKAVILVSYARVKVSLDGHVQFEVAEPNLAAGCAGVWCNVSRPKEVALDPKALPFQVNSLNALMRQNAVFDDIKVDSVESLEEDFRQAGPLAGGWLVGSGEWLVKAEPGKAGELNVRPGPWASKSLIGARHWAQYELECEIDPGSTTAGIVFLYRDESDYVAARTDGRVLQLVRVEQGKETPVDQTTLPEGAAKDGFVPLHASIQHGYIKVAAPGGAMVQGFEEEGILRGRAGLMASQGKGAEPARFRRFRLAFLQEAEPLVTTNAIFEDETTMKDWTSPTSEWFPPRNPLSVEGQPVNLLWHRSQFPGDVELAVEPRQIQDEKHEIALSVSKDGKGSNNGYVFRYRAGRPTNDGKTATVIELLRQGETVKEKVLEGDAKVRELSSLSLRRAGSYVVGKINGKPALVWKDEKPLVGSRVAYYSRGVEVKVESAKIVSDHFRNELFSRAPVDWRTSGMAIAEVTNRWQCDPRWSFFSLKSDLARRDEGKAAVLWSKYLYPGDVTVEYFVGNKMEGERGRPYTYARDINVTICSDGNDLTKGYTFMFGGQGNKGSYILRDGVEVKSTPLKIPTDMNYHRHWFSVRVEKRGNRVSYRIDRYFSDSNSESRQSEGELVFEDDKPLTGMRVAIWTYDHATMISRVRISGDGGAETEDPGAGVPALKTVYDNEK
ncbi:MAG: hypothetical protein KIS92_09755 [Planctomycetota bacterium]|nr:hypothetical protein [Planctomycetota bacterium]